MARGAAFNGVPDRDSRERKTSSRGKRALGRRKTTTREGHVSRTLRSNAHPASYHPLPEADRQFACPEPPDDIQTPRLRLEGSNAFSFDHCTRVAPGID